MAGPEQTTFQSGDQGLRRAADGHQQFAHPDAFLAATQTTWRDPAAQNNEQLIAQGVFPEVKFEQPEPAEQKRPRVGYQDNQANWHFAISDNDIAGHLKESVWNAARDAVFPHQKNPDAHYDKAAAELSATIFPNLRKYADKFDGALIIEAIARNEQMYYDP